MATTTTFGWQTPDDTDLVKDGAAAIRTLGQSIDTSMMDLEGGTTGQVLAKNSSTDMDFIWTTIAGGLSLISTTAMSGATTTISSIPTTYKELRLVLTGLGSTNDNFCQMQLNGDSGNNYQFSSIRMTNTTQSGASSSTSAGTFFDSAFMAIASNDKSSALFELPRYTDTSGQQAFYSRALGFQNSGSQYMIQCFGSYAKSAAITSITFISPTGTFDAGNAYLYGVS